MPPREVHVHLTPQLAEPPQFRGADAVVIDVLRATTTIIHALAAGCVALREQGAVTGTLIISSQSRTSSVNRRGGPASEAPEPDPQRSGGPDRDRLLPPGRG